MPRARRRVGQPAERFNIQYLSAYLTSPLPAPAYPVDVTAGITDWQMLGNGPDPTCTKDPNGVGDCTFAGRQHYRMAKAAAIPETETWESSNALVTEYLAYDHGKDQGANIADLLLYWYKAGTIQAFAPLDHTNPAEVDAAMAAFHGVYVGVNLTDDAIFGRRHIHGRLVAFERQDCLVLAHALPRRDEDFDDRHILEVADVGKPEFVRHACLSIGPRSQNDAPHVLQEAREMAHEASARGAVDHPVIVR